MELWIRRNVKSARLILKQPTCEQQIGQIGSQDGDSQEDKKSPEEKVKQGP
jgi:hypothetical protein